MLCILFIHVGVKAGLFKKKMQRERSYSKCYGAEAIWYVTKFCSNEWVE